MFAHELSDPLDDSSIQLHFLGSHLKLKETSTQGHRSDYKLCNRLGSGHDHPAHRGLLWSKGPFPTSTTKPQSAPVSTGSEKNRDCFDGLWLDRALQNQGRLRPLVSPKLETGQTGPHETSIFLGRKHGRGQKSHCRHLERSVGRSFCPAAASPCSQL